MIESYVMGVADPQEVAELEQLKLAHPEIAAAIAECERWFSAVAEWNAVPPPAAIEQRVFDSINEPESRDVKVPPAQVKKFPAYLAAASLIFCLLTAGLAIYFYKSYRQQLEVGKTLLAEQQKLGAQLEQLQQNMAILSAPGLVRVSLAGTKGHESNLVTLYWEPQTKNVYLITNKLPQAPQGYQYQLWALVNGKPVDAGLLNNCEDLCLLKPVQEAQAFAITLEKAGGSPVPSLHQLFVMGNVKS